MKDAYQELPDSADTASTQSQKVERRMFLKIEFPQPGRRKTNIPTTRFAKNNNKKNTTYSELRKNKNVTEYNLNALMNLCFLCKSRLDLIFFVCLTVVCTYYLMIFFSLSSVACNVNYRL